MNEIISIKAFNRPLYLLRVLNALSCCRHIEKYPVLISCDHFDEINAQQILEAIQSSRLRIKTKVHAEFHEKTLGCAGNMRYCLENSFSNGETFTIHFEDDTLPSIDCLEYFEQVISFLEKHPDKYFAACAMHRPCHQLKCPVKYNKYGGIDDPDLTTLQTKYWFEPAGGFAITKDEYDKIQSDLGVFGVEYISERGKNPTIIGKEWYKECTISDRLSWGWPFEKYYRNTRKCIYPYIGRVFNIGKSGLHSNYNQYVKTHENKWWVGNNELKDFIDENPIIFDTDNIIDDNKTYVENDIYTTDNLNSKSS